MGCFLNAQRRNWPPPQGQMLRRTMCGEQCSDDARQAGARAFQMRGSWMESSDETMSSLMASHAAPAKHVNAASAKLPENLEKKKLGAYLRQHYAFPRKHRLVSWTVLLQLPGNREAFEGLLALGDHPVVSGSLSRCNIRDKPTFRKLSTVCHALGHWTDALAFAKYLPDMVYPILTVCENDTLSCFEIVATFFLNWGKDWFSCQPWPPIDYLALIENIIRKNDTALAEHFHSISCDLRLTLWSVTSSLMCEVIEPEAWLMILDNVFYEPLGFFQCACAAFFLSSRTILMSTKSPADVETFCKRLQPANPSRIVARAKQLLAGMSLGVPALNDACTAIPAGPQFPIFRLVNEAVFDFERNEFDRIVKEEEEFLLRKRITEGMKERVMRLQEEENEARRKRQLLMELEARRRKNEEEQNTLKMQRAAKLEEEQRAIRIARIEAMQYSAMALVEDSVKRQQEALSQVEVQLREQQELQQKHMKASMEDEMIMAMEAESAIKLEQMHKEMSEQQRIEELQKTVELRRMQFDSNEALRLAMQKADEEERRIKVQARLSQAEALSAAASDAIIRKELESRLQSMDSELSQQVAALNLARRIHKTAEDEAVSTADAVDELRRRTNYVASPRTSKYSQADHGFESLQQVQSLADANRSGNAGSSVSVELRDVERLLALQEILGNREDQENSFSLFKNRQVASNGAFDGSQRPETFGAVCRPSNPTTPASASIRSFGSASSSRAESTSDLAAKILSIRKSQQELVAASSAQRSSRRNLKLETPLPSPSGVSFSRIRDWQQEIAQLQSGGYRVASSPSFY